MKIKYAFGEHKRRGVLFRKNRDKHPEVIISSLKRSRHETKHFNLRGSQYYAPPPGITANHHDKRNQPDNFYVKNVITFITINH